MPHIFDNIERHLLPTLQETMRESTRAAFCVGYFNLRGWDALAPCIEHFEGTEESSCHILIGMHRLPEDTMRDAQRAIQREAYLDGPTIARLRQQAAQSFREQLEFGVPSKTAESALRHLARQLRAGKVRVRLFLGHPLHAKLYLLHRADRVTPLVGYLGSSNLTLSGLSHQGELNVDVVDHDAAYKLQRWFDDRWNDRFAFDITNDLAELIETSWAAERLVKPHHIYLKMAYHLSEEARRGEREFTLPSSLRGILLPFQEKAVSLAAYHLQRRGGVLLGDVVGLGKTMMATAIARVFQEDDNSNTLIICPPRLQTMWQHYVDTYQLTARVVSIGRVIEDLPDLPRYRLVVIDESHNLRNREGKRYAAVRDYIARNDSRVLLLTATPYNKQYSDLSNQLRLFLDEDQDLHVRPERFFQEYTRDGVKNEADFIADFQASPRSLRAFEQSRYPDDWRDLMRMFLVRRTRQFIIRNYGELDPGRQRHFVLLGDRRMYFPKRQPKTVTFDMDESHATNPYARLFTPEVVKLIAHLALPRYNLGEYLVAQARHRATAGERAIIENLERAGRRLTGFSRTNLFKRLESSGYSFLRSVDHHILRNFVTLHALESGQPIPIGAQDAALLDPFIVDADEEAADPDAAATGEAMQDDLHDSYVFGQSLESYRERAGQIYATYRKQQHKRFGWLSPKLFGSSLADALINDSIRLLEVLQQAGAWQPHLDTKLNELHRLIGEQHANDKVLVFTQFADTARYLYDELRRRGVTSIEVATGQSADPTALARRFSPRSNGGLKPGEQELRVLIATDVIGEGQNLQDAFVVVNFDLPWAIIRLIQRAGRVDRIGQQRDTIFVYSFLPAEGIEMLLGLRGRLIRRLQQNQEVVGSDEAFFGEDQAEKLRDLYTERSGVLDDDDDDDNDLASTALQIWNSASEEDRRAALQLPEVIGAARPLRPDEVERRETPGVMTYLRFPDGADALVRVDQDGNLVSQSLAATFRVAACSPETPALPLDPDHHELVRRAVQQAVQEQTTWGGQLGSLRSTRRKVYERLKLYRERLMQRPDLFTSELLAQLDPVMNAIMRYPLKEAARESLGRQLRLNMPDSQLAEMVIRLHGEERLVTPVEEREQPEPHVVCSLGLREIPAS